MASQAVSGYPSAEQMGIMVGAPPPHATHVNLTNWQLPPWNRWSFLHTREVLPSANVSRGSGPVAQFPEAPQDIGEILFTTPDGSTHTLAAFLSGSWTDGMIVVHKGSVVFESLQNNLRGDTRHIAMSVSKSITSLVIGTLVGRGQLDPALPVTRYVPELVGTAYDGATIQHTLDMEVANSWREDYFSDTTEFWRLDVACGWLPPREGAATSLFEFICQSRRNGEHGQEIQYSSLNPDLLGVIAERVSGSRFPELVSEVLWVPTGMEWDADLLVDPGGTAVADGGYCATLRDFARVGMLMLNHGVVDGLQVIPEQWINESQRPNSTPFHSMSYGADWPGASYHNQWWRMDGRTFALGIHGQMIAVDADADVVVVFLSSPPEPNDAEQRMTQRRLVDGIAKALH
jgi:CubicO group peptidase (beta-lactamase class C family)